MTWTNPKPLPKNSQYAIFVNKKNIDKFHNEENKSGLVNELLEAYYNSEAV